jgi:1-aminocyclopropane-1-carboxylate deaminase
LNQKIAYKLPNGISITIKREDLCHPFVSGNKYRKLKYNLLQAKAENRHTLLTFGGAYSNHIAAVAYAGREQGFKTIGIIRGEELSNKKIENPTLKFAQEYEMQFEFVTRETYRLKTEDAFIDKLHQKWGSFYLIPEGGTNEYAVKGCQEILTEEDAVFDFICCPVGTGGTLSGISNSAAAHQRIIGFSALKGDFLNQEIGKFANNTNWELQTNYHFGGYAKVTEELIQLINTFYKQTNVPLDPIYTGKMVFGVMDLIQKNYFPHNSKILIIHTGGLQGIEGMNLILKSKNKTVIDVE